MHNINDYDQIHHPKLQHVMPMFATWLFVIALACVVRNVRDLVLGVNNSKSTLRTLKEKLLQIVEDIVAIIVRHSISAANFIIMHDVILLQVQTGYTWSLQITFLTHIHEYCLDLFITRSSSEIKKIQ